MSKLPVNDKTPRSFEDLRSLIIEFLPSAFPVISQDNGEILICTGLRYNKEAKELEPLDEPSEADLDKVENEVDKLLAEVLNSTKGTTRMRADDDCALIEPSDDEFIN